MDVAGADFLPVDVTHACYLDVCCKICLVISVLENLVIIIMMMIFIIFINLPSVNLTTFLWFDMMTQAANQATGAEVEVQSSRSEQPDWRSGSTVPL
jgi:hypothetical protein